MELFLSALGLAMIIEGLSYFTFPRQVKDLASRLPQFPDSAIRTFGFLTLGAGLLLIYLARHFF
ncbi:MAG: DUF2065 domain-containing protein [Deltaproteobacteria bacterium]|nr:DUF2065 domain-containing protein [Deltaproteobacteria bacterium]